MSRYNDMPEPTEEELFDATALVAELRALNPDHHRGNAWQRHLEHHLNCVCRGFCAERQRLFEEQAREGHWSRSAPYVTKKVTTYSSGYVETMRRGFWDASVALADVAMNKSTLVRQPEGGIEAAEILFRAERRLSDMRVAQAVAYRRRTGRPLRDPRPPRR